MKSRGVIVGLTVVAVVVAFLIGVKFYRDSEAERIGFLSDTNFELFVRDHSPKMGPENPKVFLIEFLDPECESCREFYPHVKSILKEYKDDVTWVVRYMPLHKNAPMVVKILEAARKQGKYFETLEALFYFQPIWGDHHDPKPEVIWEILPKLKLDIEQIKKDMQDPKIEEMIAQDMEDAAKLGNTGTPTFFVNGKKLTVFSPMGLKRMISNEISR